MSGGLTRKQIIMAQKIVANSHKLKNVPVEEAMPLLGCTKCCRLRCFSCCNPYKLLDDEEDVDFNLEE
jgi:hypothetical protein